MTATIQNGPSGRSLMSETQATHPEYGQLLRQYRERLSISQNQLATRAGIDSSYLNRCEAGTRQQPHRVIVEAMARALRLTVPERDRLLMAAGYSAWEWSDALQSVADVLNDLDLTAEERDRFRAGVRALAEPWLALARVRR